MNESHAATPSLLVGRGITKRFGTHTALSRVDFELASGEVKGLVGANGAGKSTLLKVLAGAISPDEGELVLQGVPIKMMSMLEANRHGIALVSQELSLFPALSVRENFTIVARGHRHSGHAALDEAARGVLSELGLSVSLDLPVQSLDLADRQLIEIARALLVNPRVLILDEPTSALHSAEKIRLLGIVKRLRARGVGIIYVSHFLREVLDVADEVVVLRDGRRVPVALASATDRLPQVVSAMLGEPVAHGGARDASRTAHTPATAVPAGRGRSLVLSGIKGPFKLDVPDWKVDPGAVVGVAGLAGAGVHELFGILFGRLRVTAGVGSLPSGQPLPRSMAQAVRSGVAYIPADRKRIGLMLQRSVVDNLFAVRSLVQGRDGLFPDQTRLDATARTRCAALAVRSDSVKRAAAALSGGNQQKVVLAKWLATNPKVLILEEATRGVDVGAKQEIYRIIREIAEQGFSILLISTEMPEVLGMCDRILVLREGKFVASFQRGEASQAQLLNAASRMRVAEPVS
jgi:ABC-type sugar transport system ATPase subunit